MKHGYKPTNFRNRLWNCDLKNTRSDRISGEVEIVKPATIKIEYCELPCPICNRAMVKKISKKDNVYYKCVKATTKKRCLGVRFEDSKYPKSMYQKLMNRAGDRTTTGAVESGHIKQGKNKKDSTKPMLYRPREPVKIKIQQPSIKWLYDDEGNRVRRLS